MYSLQEERVSWATGQQLGSDLASDPFPSNDRGYSYVDRESRLTTEELLQAVSIHSVTEYNSMLRIMVSSQSQDAVTQELEDLITRPFPRNIHLQSTYMTTLFEL
jgi:hypothetical protein